MSNRYHELHLAARAGNVKKDRPAKLPFRSKGHRRKGLGSGPAPFRQSTKLQAVIVQVAYGENNGTSNWRAHGRYLVREGGQREDERGLGFDARREDRDIADTLKHWQESGDPRFFKIMVSAENGNEMDLKEHTRDLLANMEKDLGTRLEWVAIDHYNTDNPHVHIAMRGVDEKGKEIWIDRDYLCAGIRQRAREVATKLIGFRTEQDIDRQRYRLIEVERFTALDHAIIKQSKDHTVTFDDKPADTPRAQEHRIQELGRLQVLTDMGLAEKTGPRQWKLSPQMEQTLRQMQISKDLVKRRALERDNQRQRNVVRTVDDLEQSEEIRP